MSQFIRNNGEMRIVTSVKLLKKDVEAIRKGQDEGEIIQNKLLSDLENIDSVFKNHIRALSWMIAHDKLKIKIAVVTGHDGYPISKEEVDETGIFHQKIGILEDDIGNKVVFSGSVNESLSGWTKNIEQLDVFRNWVSGENEHLSKKEKTFEKYWTNKAKAVRVTDVPEAVRDKLIQFAPESLDDLDNFDEPEEPVTIQKPIPRQYQKEAIQHWRNNNYHGLLCMATGTGKTITALTAMEELISEKGKLAVVVVVPQQHLVDQWNEVFSELYELNPILSYDDSNDWTKDFNSRYAEYVIGSRSQLYVITTYATLSSNADFNRKIQKLSKGLLIISDEAHHLGSEKYLYSMPDARFRMGITATPERWNDPEGTKRLISYFDKIVFEYPLRKAIEDGYLNRYLYIPNIIQLSQDDFDRYVELTKEYREIINGTGNGKLTPEVINQILEVRAKILNKSPEKIAILRDLITSRSPITHTLIYCQDVDQIREVADSLFNIPGLLCARVTYLEGKQNGKQDRKRIISSFKEGKFNALLAVRCLDEGVDIPTAKTAIMLASSGNPAQFIQRRGRVLRILRDPDGKPLRKTVEIIDMIIIPKINKQMSKKIQDIEKRIREKEIERYLEFADTAENREEARGILEKLRGD